MLDTLMHSKKNIGFEDNSSGRFREMIQVLRQRDLLHGITRTEAEHLEDLRLGLEKRREEILCTQ